MTIVAKFTGARDADGAPLEYHAGIPALDLDEAAYEALTKEQRATVDGSPLYSLRGRGAEKAADKPATPAALPKPAAKAQE